MDLQPAGFSLRFVAAFIDSVVILFVQYALSLVIILAVGVGRARFAMVLSALVGLVAGALYYALMESSKRRGTLGKILVDIEVTDTDGFTLHLEEAIIRHLWRLVSFMTLGFGFAMAAWSREGLALHDRMSGTRVVIKEEVFEEEE